MKRFRIVWWGWRRWWQRPVWACSVLVPGPAYDDHRVRELGIGPVSFQWWAAALRTEAKP